MRNKPAQWRNDRAGHCQCLKTEILSVHTAVLIHAKKFGFVTTGTCIELNEHDFWACSRKSVDKIEVMIWATMAFSQMSSLIQYILWKIKLNEDSKKKRDRSLSIRSPSNTCQIVTVGVYHPHAATFVMHASLRIRATGKSNALTFSSIVHSFAYAPG